MKIGIAGAPSCGKTTTILALKKIGMKVYEEQAPTIIHNMGGASNLSNKQRKEVDQLLFDSRFNQYRDSLHLPGKVFFDSTLPYSKFFLGGDITEEQDRRIYMSRYDLVFWLNQLAHFEKTDFRIENNMQDAYEKGQLIKDAHYKLGYQLIEVDEFDENKDISVLKRVTKILAKTLEYESWSPIDKIKFKVAAGYKPLVYIAGPGVFKDYDSLKIKQMITDFGFEPLYPLDNELSDGVTNVAYDIFLGNKHFIDICDICIADLSYFRGKDCDSGTSGEVGYTSGKGKLIYGYHTSKTQVDKILGDNKFNGQLKDTEGYSVEDFGLSVNLMMPGFATHSGGDIILNNSEDDNSYFKSLEKCLQRLKSDIYD